ncbi:MAG: hypothetical protein IPO08_20630 [Xanthomonadales bacterium]|nr:hypothetical protein [Xanthomonadales bacterium]
MYDDNDMCRGDHEYDQMRDREILERLRERDDAIIAEARAQLAVLTLARQIGAS